MTDHAKMRQALMDGAIAAVANYGLEGTTTRRIVAFGNINEGYIYRYYEDRDDLLKKTFLKIDQKIESIVEAQIPTLKDMSIPKKERFTALYNAVVNYFMEHKDESAFYLRYYESTFLAGDVWAEHKSMYKNLVAEVIPMLKDERYAFHASHHIFRALAQMGTSKVKTPDKAPEDGFDPNLDIIFTVFDAYYK